MVLVIEILIFKSMFNDKGTVKSQIIIHLFAIFGIKSQKFSLKTSKKLNNNLEFNSPIK